MPPNGSVLAGSIANPNFVAMTTRSRMGSSASPTSSSLTYGP
jgi:hypothetical protein